MNLGSNGEVFLGRDYSKTQAHSDHTARLVDSEVRGLLENAYGLARRILLENKHILEKIAETLLDKETLNAKEFGDLIQHNNPIHPTLQPV